MYCLNSDADGNVAKNDLSSITFLGGMSTGIGGWVEREGFDETSDYDYGTTHSSVPGESVRVGEVMNSSSRILQTYRVRIGFAFRLATLDLTASNVTNISSCARRSRD